MWRGKIPGPLSALWERNILEAMLSVPFVPLSICPRSNIYVSLLNSEPSFLSCFLRRGSVTTFTRLHSATAGPAWPSGPPLRLCYLTFPVSALLRQPFWASFMFSLINYSAGDAKAISGTDCQLIKEAVNFVCRGSAQERRSPARRTRMLVALSELCSAKTTPTICWSVSRTGEALL